MTGLHLETHELPISNDYSSSDGKIYVYCGRCDGHFMADRDWALRYWERILGIADRERARRLTPLQNNLIQAGLMTRLDFDLGVLR